MLIRYLNKEKFEWLLCDKGIYVGAASNQTDKNEGMYDHTLISKTLRLRVPHANAMMWDEVDKVTGDLMLTKRDSCYISSWYFGKNETREMWDEYGSDGVALVSNKPLLVKDLPGPLGHASSFYEVIYDNDHKLGAINEPLMLKEKKFQHESEFRLVVDINAYSVLTGFEKERFSGILVGGIPSYESPEITCCMSPEDIEQSHRVIRKKGLGYVISFDLQEIVREVRLHPDCTEENEQWVKNRLEVAGLNIPVRHSTLRTQNMG